MEQKDLSIGFMDSGLGGISVMRCVMDVLPSERFIYYGDNANAPYGEKTEEEIAALSMACAEFLVEKGVKAIVVACNTATSVAVVSMRERFNIPVVSIEPAVKPAMQTKGGILVLATPATLSQNRYHALVDRLGCQDRVINVPCPGLSEMVETYEFDSPVIEDYLKERLRPYSGMDIGGIVIGCTHYSFVTPLIEKAAAQLLRGERRVFDGRFGTACHLETLLKQKALLCSKRSGSVAFYSSGPEPCVVRFEQALTRVKGLEGDGLHGLEG